MQATISRTLAPPLLNLPSLKMTALSYSWTTFKKDEKMSFREFNKIRFVANLYTKN